MIYVTFSHDAELHLHTLHIFNQFNGISLTWSWRNILIFSLNLNNIHDTLQRIKFKEEFAVHLDPKRLKESIVCTKISNLHKKNDENDGMELDILQSHEFLLKKCHSFINF